MTHFWRGIRVPQIRQPLGYEANGTRPMPPIGSFGVPLIQREPSMVSHPVQPVLPLPTASLLLFLLRPPVDHLGEQRSPPAHGMTLHAGRCVGLQSTWRGPTARYLGSSIPHRADRAGPGYLTVRQQWPAEINLGGSNRFSPSPTSDGRAFTGRRLCARTSDTDHEEHDGDHQK